jgi:hypothetical protein
MSTKLLPAHSAPRAVIAASLLLLLLGACAAPMSSDDTYFMAQNVLHLAQATVAAVWRA